MITTYHQAEDSFLLFKTIKTQYYVLGRDAAFCSTERKSRALRMKEKVQRERD